MNKKEIEEYSPKSKAHLRKWFQKNHITKDAVWFIFHKKHTGKPSVIWSDAVDEALCFGWIDSKGETIDKDTFRGCIPFCRLSSSKKLPGQSSPPAAFIKCS